MATLFITEFAGRATDANGIPMEMPLFPELAEQTVAIGGSSTQSSAFHRDTTFVRIHTDVICSIKFGTNPTASATTARMAAGATEYFGVPKGMSYEVAVITNS